MVRLRTSVFGIRHIQICTPYMTLLTTSFAPGYISRMSGVTLDDADIGVVYSGQWYAFTSWSSAYKRTMHITTSLNAKATLTFQGELFMLP